MSLETVSEKRNRVYPRKFDHDEARVLHAAGATYAELAERYGVSQTGVARVCDPEVNRRLQEGANSWSRNHRTPCLGDCGRLVWTAGRQGQERTGYCSDCFHAKQAAEHPDVREDELRCTVCREWKPDEEFPTNNPSKLRRGRNPKCRSCASAARRDYRRRHPKSGHDENQRARQKRMRKRGATMQSYVVLRPDGNGGYNRACVVDAASPAHAVELAADAAGEAGEYVAVLESRFVPMEVEPVRAFKVKAKVAE